MSSCFIGVSNNLDCFVTVSVCFFQYTLLIFHRYQSFFDKHEIDEVSVASFTEVIFNKTFSERNTSLQCNVFDEKNRFFSKSLHARSQRSHTRKKMELQEDSKYKRCSFSKEFKLKVVKYYHDNMENNNNCNIFSCQPKTGKSISELDDIFISNSIFNLSLELPKKNQKLSLKVANQFLTEKLMKSCF